MKKGLFFKFSLLLLFVLFLQDSFAQDSPQWHLPKNVTARLGRGSIVEMRYSPDGTRLAVASSIGSWFYDTTTLQEVDLFTGHTSWVTSIAYSPDGQMLARGVARGDNTIRLWEAITGEHKRTLTGHSWTVHSVAFSPNGKTLASGSGDQTVRLWEVATSEQKETLFAQGSTIWSLVFSPDGNTLASAGSREIRLWDTVTGEQKGAVIGYEDEILSLAFSPDGRTLASGGGRWDYTLRLWDVVTGVSKGILTGHTWTVTSLAFSPDGETLATGSGDGTVLLWELPPPTAFGDVNDDGVVNLQDLMYVSLNLGGIGQNDADINGDGVVNIFDLVTVAGVIGEAAAAPSAHPATFGSLTAAEVQGWLTQAQGLDLMDLRLRRGIFFLEQLLVALTPQETGLLPSYPNPFNPETWIPYHLAHASDVTLTIYATTGGMVRQLDLGHQPAGSYTARNRAAYWDGRNRNGELVASGIYFYQLRASGYTATRRIVIVK